MNDCRGSAGWRAAGQHDTEGLLTISVREELPVGHNCVAFAVLLFVIIL